MSIYKVGPCSFHKKSLRKQKPKLYISNNLLGKQDVNHPKPYPNQSSTNILIDNEKILNSQ